MEKYTGKSIVKGLGFGLITKIKLFELKNNAIKLSNKEVVDELAKAKDIYQNSVKALQDEIIENQAVLNEETLAIINGHIILIEDEEITDRINEIIETEKVDFVTACIKTQSEFIEMFNEIEDPYIKERVADIKDICQRFIKTYQHVLTDEFSGIVVAKEITPSDILNFKQNEVFGIISERNTANCHAAILARTLDIPFVTGISGIYDACENEDVAIIDYNKVIINPVQEEYMECKEKFKVYLKNKAELKKYIGRKAVLKDGKVFPVGVNLGNQADCLIASEVNAESVGLFRSEYLYMDTVDFPTEDYLYDKYYDMTKDIKGEITIRTLDVGGDKSVAYFNIPKEDNPYLGYRAIRYCLDNQDVLKTQFKAILRLSAIRQVKIMIPMITKLDEVIESKRILEESKKELIKEGHNFNKNIQLGIMIETPASVLISDILAKELDFFSIGTNDLLQYTMAADRNNQLVDKNYNPYSIAFLRMIELTVKNANKMGIPVSVCGEIAANEEFLPLLIALGVKKISVTPSALLRVKKELANLTTEDCIKELEKVMNFTKEKDMQYYLTEKTNG